MGQRWPQATCVEVLARDNQILSLIIEAHPERKLEARQKLSPAQWTGDADLGIRASQRGYTVGVICSTTYDEVEAACIKVHEPVVLRLQAHRSSSVNHCTPVWSRNAIVVPEHWVSPAVVWSSASTNRSTT